MGQDIDAQAAVRIAKAMIVDGRMPTPEEARRRRTEREANARTTAARPAQDATAARELGEPWVLLEDRVPVRREGE